MTQPNNKAREILEAELDWSARTGKTIRLHKVTIDINHLINQARLDELEKAGVRAIKEFGNELGLKVLEINDKRHAELKEL